MPQRTSLVTSDQTELSNFLFGKGLEIEDLTQSISRAIAAYNNTTKNHPATYRGFMITAETNVALREILAARGYVKKAPSNIEITVSDEHKFGIHVLRGDQETGMLSGYPCSLRAKGVLSQEFFGLTTSATNQIDMFSEELPNHTSPKCPYDIWFLMLYVIKDEHSGVTIRAELSKPEYCSQKGIINGFSKRYLIDMQSFMDTLIIDLDESPDEGFSDDLDIDISLM
ncbi:hypothetical protein O1O06_04920 [Grimontia hollisae]|uniref:hypothetical protein n=1 Tax=Grimontia hollisae TaxID=673 RepID=UPI0023DCD343|nr:hypothetical protein [Grimontia hollisae]MDF2184109.1 hypothetical protein [Grimontia hollisae]